MFVFFVCFLWKILRKEFSSFTNVEVSSDTNIPICVSIMLSNSSDLQDLAFSLFIGILLGMATGCYSNKNRMD